MTRRSAACGTLIRTASLVTVRPGGMVTVRELPKVSRRMVPVAAVGLLGAAARASVACETVSGLVP